MVKFEETDEYRLKIFTDNIVSEIPFKALTKIEDWCSEEEVNEYSGYGSGDTLFEIYEDYFDKIISEVVYYQL